MGGNVRPEADVRSAFKRIEDVAKSIVVVGGAITVLGAIVRELATFVRAVAAAPVQPVSWGKLLDVLFPLGVLMYGAGLTWIVLGRLRGLEARIDARVAKRLEETLGAFELRTKSDVAWQVDERFAQLVRELAAKAKDESQG